VQPHCTRSYKLALESTTTFYISCAVRHQPLHPLWSLGSGLHSGRLLKNKSEIQPDTLHADTQGAECTRLRSGSPARDRTDAQDSELEGSHAFSAVQGSAIPAHRPQPLPFFASWEHTAGAIDFILPSASWDEACAQSFSCGISRIPDCGGSFRPQPTRVRSFTTS
jgi:hypothetical protein